MSKPGKRADQIARKLAREKQQLKKEMDMLKRNSLLCQPAVSTPKAASSAPKKPKVGEETVAAFIKRKKIEAELMVERELTAKATTSAAQQRKAAEETAINDVVRKIKKEKDVPASNVTDKQAFQESGSAVLKNIKVEKNVSP